MIDVNSLIGTHDVLLMTLDTLRYDVAVTAMNAGQTPNLEAMLPGGRWEHRHSPGSFTYAAHHAFFGGFLPTPARPGPHPRLFASRFPGSETTTPQTCIFDASNIVEGLADAGYHTVCIGGVGFFNRQSKLGSVFPNLFRESHWDESLGVTDLRSTENQIRLADDVIDRLPAEQRLFLFLNVSALHQPNCMYMKGRTTDSAETQAAALAYVDSCLPPLFDRLRRRASTLCILTSDHGTAYGEDDFWGHRLGHPSVWDVPYAEFVSEMD